MFDGELGHHYMHFSTERSFYRLLQANGFGHAQGARELMDSRVPCYTVNAGPFRVPHFEDGGNRVKFALWYPDAVIHVPGKDGERGNVYFIELKSRGMKNRWKYRNFKQYFAQGKGARSLINAGFRQEIEKFFDLYGLRGKIRFHLLADVPVNPKTQTLNRKSEKPGALPLLFRRYAAKLEDG